MVELKTLTSPKVAVPILGIVVLIVVSTLVALFYIRNPTVTDNLFGSNQENTTLSTHSEGGMMHVDRPIQTGNSSDSMHSERATTVKVHYTTLVLTTTSAPPATLPATSAPDTNSTPMHAIEPVQHL